MLTDSDIGVHNMVITATSQTLGEVTKTVYFSVDKHDTQIRDCDGQNYIVPEVTADNIASSCIPGFNPDLKPTVSGPDYTLDLTDLECAKSVVANATQEEKQSWESYEKNPEDMFNGCSTAQIQYTSRE